MKSPIFNGLYKYARMQRIPFNAPGHKGKVTMRTKSLSRLDMYGSSKDGDSLNLRELIMQSEDIITEKYKTCRSIYLRNGATGGIYAMLGAYLRRGDKVIVAKYAGTEVKLDGEEYSIVRQSDILATIE